MKYLFTLTLLLINSILIGQIQFNELLPVSPTPTNISDFIGVRNGSCAYADVDGDNDLDVFICGEIDATSPSYGGISKLYLNDGSGNFFVDLINLFPTQYVKQAAFSDVDNDGDQDILIGTSLYLNDGNGLFTEDMSTSFPDSNFGFILFCDVDGDVDEDVLISGLSLGLPFTKLYSNDGNGSFNEVLNVGFESVSDGASDFSDVDGDNDFDIVITGKNSLGVPVSKLYINDGNGVFVENISIIFDGVYASSVNLIDIDGDSDDDLFISGSQSSSIRVSKVYINDGVGVFNEQIGQSIQGFGESSSSFGDIDNDNDVDLIICGNIGYSSGSYIVSTKLYINDGTGNFTEETVTPFEGVNDGFTIMLDLDGDSYLDIIIGGVTDYFSLQLLTKIYSNTGNGDFLEAYSGIFSKVNQSSITSADINNDGNQDLFITGYDGEKLVSKLFVNNGVGNFTESLGTPFPELRSGSVKFSDVDNDGDQDLLITGSSSSNQAITELYLNDGTGIFTLETNSLFFTRRFSSIAFADIDNDGDEDVLISGESPTGGLSTYLYENDGNGVFSKISGTSFTGVSSGDIGFSDIDNDGDLDVLITGNSSTYNSNRVSKFYLNNGSGSYSYHASLVGLGTSSIGFSDIDNDGDEDVLITGRTSSLNKLTLLYENDGLGNFSTVTGLPFINVMDGSVSFSDVDSDGYEDVLICGMSDGGHVSVLYKNNGSGSFSELSSTMFTSVSSCSSAFIDIDSDNDEDLILVGKIDIVGSDNIAKIYSNTTCLVGIDNSVTLTGITIQATEINADNYIWLNCDNNYTSVPLPISISSYEVPSPGNYAVEITKNGCIDTSYCIIITHQDFYNLPDYSPLSAEAFAFPVTDLDSCNGFVLGFGNGGFPPYSFDWFTQTNNDFYSELDSLCEGFHVLKIVDMLGDSALVNYFVPDSSNWFNWYLNNGAYVDTIYAQVDNCVIDMSLPLDSASVSNMTYLYSGIGVNEDYYYIEISYFQTGTQYTYGDTVLMELNGVYLIDFSITCPSKSTSRIKTLLITLDYPTILGIHTSTESQFKVYPNPTLNNVTIDLGEMNSNSNILITNFSGKIVYNEVNVNSKSIEVNLKNYSTGLYFVTIENNRGKSVMKLVKQ